MEKLTDAIARGKDELDEVGESRRATDLRPFTPAAIAELRELLGRARGEAGGDAAVLKRVDLLEAGLRWTNVEARAHALRVAPREPDAKTKAKGVLDERRALMRELFVNHPLAINVAMVSWGEDGMWKPLGWTHPKQ